MRSHLLVGKVRHRRARPFVYELEHDVFYAALDLGELDEVASRSRLIRRNRRGLVELRDADHLPDPATDLDADVRRLLRAEGDDPTGWRITLITNLRILGYVFNPASFFLCRDAAGTLRRVIVEVHNTFGERHLYPLRPGGSSEAGGDDEAFRAGMPKEFFVSPFISIDGSYAVHVRDDAEGTRIAIALRQAEGPMLSTSLVLQRRRLTDRNLLRLMLRYPLMTQRTIGLIHLHAIRLWLRGAPFFRHGQARRAAEGVGRHGVVHVPGSSR
ncbi:MAG TPA: DUF1365 domain-containing protein [Candidatus Limnocylindrales bacterium]|jgi:hypothetical protein|nr:DUF1365 domain-containing protein [Candidatus Limnocylindrales bacterium]